MNHIQQLPRAERRAAMAYLKQENAKWPEALKEWPRDEWPKPSDKILRALRSRTFLVQVYAADFPAAFRLSINRTSITSDGGWQQDITWEELQRLKREAGYGHCEAVEVFPADDEVVNVANMRHLWILCPGNLPFAWHKKETP